MLVFRGVMAVFLFGACVAPAAADITGFIGSATSPTSRLVRGVAVGAGLLVLGFEFEYADAVEDEDSDAPSLRTGMGNVLLQTPLAIKGFQPYFTTGGGVYHERLGDDSSTDVGMNVGGGVKITLAGPLRVRVDYRVFTLRGSPRVSPVHRFYAGVNLNF
jgi:opacity protein-like surface antigen